MYHITEIHKENKKKEIEKKCSPLNKRMKREKNERTRQNIIWTVVIRKKQKNQEMFLFRIAFLFVLFSTKSCSFETFFIWTLFTTIDNAKRVTINKLKLERLCKIRCSMILFFYIKMFFVFFYGCFFWNKENRVASYCFLD